MSPHRFSRTPAVVLARLFPLAAILEDLLEARALVLGPLGGLDRLAVHARLFEVGGDLAFELAGGADLLEVLELGVDAAGGEEVGLEGDAGDGEGVLSALAGEERDGVEG